MAESFQSEYYKLAVASNANGSVEKPMFRARKMLKFQTKSVLLIVYKQWPLSLRLNTFGEKQRSLEIQGKCQMGKKKKTKPRPFIFLNFYCNNLSGTTLFIGHIIAKNQT